MAAVLTIALLIFVDGFLSLIIDRDVIDAVGAGPLVGPFMAATVCAIVVVFVARESPVSIGRRAVAGALAALVGAPAVGSILYMFARGQVGVVPVFFGHHVLSPFALAAAIVAGLVIFGAGLSRGAVR